MIGLRFHRIGVGKGRGCFAGNRSGRIGHFIASSFLRPRDSRLLDQAIMLNWSIYSAEKSARKGWKANPSQFPKTVNRQYLIAVSADLRASRDSSLPVRPCYLCKP
jgi:hypothetical protein